MPKSTKYKGGLSKEVFESYNFQEYIKHTPSGYVGSSRRTKVRDAIIEKELRDQGLGPSGIADWLTSNRGRHMMDEVEQKTSIEKFKKIVKDHTSGAFQDVTVWNHPDHRGNMASTIELKKKIFGSTAPRT